MDLKLLNSLIEQAKNPSGYVGSFMLSIMNTAHKGMNHWAIEKIKIEENMKILDIGCGGGKAIQLFSKINKYGEIYGIDYSEQAVKDSIRANKGDVVTGKVSIRQASVTHIPFPENNFDIVTAFQTHYFWSDLENAAKEIFRILKPNGSFFIFSEIYKINYHMKSYKSKEDMEKLFKKTGFQTVEFYENIHKGWLCVKGIK